MTSICIMQPYFYPYAGYFRLMMATDIFVILDCVQFPRNGWVHRNTFETNLGSSEWLRVPLIKKPRDSTRIMDLEFSNEAAKDIKNQLVKFKINASLVESKFYSTIVPDGESVVDYLEINLKQVFSSLEIEPKILKSSQLGIPEHVNGQEKIISICKLLSASKYVNLSGGIKYYDPQMFEKNDIEIKFFKPYEGSLESILQRLLFENNKKVKTEIEDQLEFMNL